ncbi:MAG: hypothetical protein AAF215_23125 [Cyanobacteria bacterium P01_A01_bin.123]
MTSNSPNSQRSRRLRLRITLVSALTESSYFQQVQKEVSEVDLDEFWSS